MATTTNYGWVTPDDTALVKDGAAAIRTLGSSVDTTTKNLNPSTTLGDIEYRSSTSNTNTRLGIGTSGQVLTVAGGVPSWAAAASGANWTLLNSGGTSLSGSTTTVSGISAKDKILIFVEGAVKSDYGNIAVRFNADTGSNYYRNGLEQYTQSSYSSSIWGRVSGTISYLQLTETYANGTSTASVSVSGCNSSGVKVYQSFGYGSGTTPWYNYNINGYYNSSSTISSISIFASAGSFSAGTVYVYTSA
jgi:hypothetical protein